jgi:hypothetical protein
MHGNLTPAPDYNQDKHYCTDYETCDTCWQCLQCCPGLENCALVIEAEDAAL